MSRYEPTSALLEFNECIPEVNTWGRGEGTDLYTILLFCYLLHDIVDAVRLAVEM